MKKRMIVVVLMLVFCFGAALTACGGAEPVSLNISASENLSCIVGTETKNIKNVKVAIKYSDDSIKDEVAISNPDVTLTPSVLNTVGPAKVEVSYKGFSGSFNVEVTEENYMTTVQAPTLTKYRNNATLDDVDLTGGRFNLYIGGAFHDVIGAERRSLKAAEINVTGLYVTYEYDLSDFGTEFKGKVAQGRFDITVDTFWPVSVALTTLPDTKSYPVATNASGDIYLDTGDVDLSGGILTVTNNDSSTEDINLPNEDKVSVTDFKLDANDCDKGIITLMLNSDIAAQKITCELNVDITDHNEGTIFSYYASLLPSDNELDWASMPRLTERQEQVAEQGIDLYLSAEFGGYKETYKNQKTKILTSYVYTGFNFINDGMDEFGALLTELLSDKSNVTAFIEYADSFCEEFDALIATLYSEFIADIINVSGNSVMVLDIIFIFEDERYALDPYLIAAPVAIDVFETISVVPDEAWNLNLQETLYAQAIESAYSKIMQMLNNDSTNMAALAFREILLAWRWDSVDIIYDYYYDDTKGISETENIEISNLFNKGILSPVLMELVPTLMDLMEFFCYNEHIMFVYSYVIFEPLIEKLDNYEYKATPALFDEVTVETIFWPARLGMTIDGKDELGLYENIPLTLMRETAETIYSGHYNKTGEVIESRELLDYIDEYSQFILKWFPSTHWGNPIAHFPRGNAAFDNDYEKIASHFNKLSLEAQNALLNYLDISPRMASPTPVFRMMSDAYLESRLTTKELQLYNATLDAYKVLITMLDGMRKDNVTSFVNQMKTVSKLFGEIQNLNEDFATYFGDILNFCLASNEIISKIPASFYPIMELIYETQMYYEKSDMTNFSRNYILLDSTLSDIFAATSYTIDSLKAFTFNGISMYDQYTSLKEIYETLA